MNESIIVNRDVKCTFSAHASLSALGVMIRKLKVFTPVLEKVRIAQKVVKFSPGEKLLDGYMAILAGAQGMVEINQSVRTDRGLQLAFGRTGCAEQSVVQDTLDACTAENVEQMHQAMNLIFRQNSRSYRHDYNLEWQILDCDMTGRPCGRKAAFASKGYFAKQRNRRGRQEGYVLASWYEEIVVERLFDGKTQLNRALQPLLEAAEETLQLNKAQRTRTIVRLDSGGGSVEEVNWALDRGYQFHGKDYSGVRAEHLAESVVEWIPDPADPSREMGWVTLNADLYVRPLRRIAVRCRKNNGQWGVGVILSTLSPEAVLWLTGRSIQDADDDRAVLLAYVHFYDQRGGGVETEIKEDKQGLATLKRNKKRFEAQQMLIQLEVLAHNTLIWARTWLSHHCPTIARFGLKRLVREVFHIDGGITFDHYAHILQICLNPAAPLAAELCEGLVLVLAREHVALSLGEI
jgi:hypothetical protein